MEFNSSLRWDYEKEIKNKALEAAVVKTVAAFLNTDMERPFVKCRRRSFLSHTSSFCSSAGSRKGRTRQGASTTSHSDIRGLPEHALG